MEAVPKLPMLSFHLKTSNESTHFGPKLKQYIAEAYREDPDSYSNEMHQLEGLRSAAVRPTIDAAGLNALNRYFCQLRAMQSRFPMAKGQPAACSFNWKDLHANMSCSLPDIRFEMACILYNIGALHTELAALEPRTTADSMKSACTHYQNAAWAFQHLREHYPQPSGVDVSTEIMRLLQEICFAQAQECILEKSIQDTRKPSVVGAVATQVVYFYKNSLALLGPSTGSENINEIIGTRLFDFWYRFLSFKAAYTSCIVCLYQGMNAEEQQKMGERVAFYQLAIERLKDARKLAKYIEPVQVTAEALTFTNDVVEGKRKAAKNENEFIYHEEVPEKDLLVDLKAVCLVKALPINFNDPEVAGQDLFSRLVPMGAHEASSMYSEEKAKLLRQVVGQVEAKDTKLTEFMSSLQLDQLDVLDSDQKIPQEIVDRCAAMNAKSEIIQTLVDSMNNLAEIISDVENSLAEIKNLIHDETLKEKEFQKTMGPRPPSIVQTELSREYHKYQEAHSRTNESNQVLHKAMTLHIANLRLLSQPLDVLESKIPNIDSIAGLDRETMTEMRRVVSKAREMQTQRESLVQQLREDITADDVTPVLLARSSEPADEIFKQELEKHTPKVKIIEQNLAAQENIINRLTSVYASYGESRRLLSDVLRKREGLINALITSYDAYEELLGKSQKGLEFYKKLAHNVSQLLTRLKSTCQVQEEERAQQLAKQHKAPTPVPTATPPPSSAGADAMAGAVAGADMMMAAGAGGPRKLKDYLPYMKNRHGRSLVPQVPAENMPPDSYYPESIYPTSVRPAPVGSEATDVSQMQLPDGVIMPQQNAPYDRYMYPEHDYNNAPSNVHHPSNYSYNKPSYDKPGTEDLYGYSAYTPPQFSSSSEQQIYSNPYYAASQNANSNATAVTDSPSFSNVHNVPVNPQSTYYDQYNQMGMPETSVAAYNTTNQTDLNAHFSQMQVSGPKSEPNYGDYSQTYYNVNYPHVSTPNPSAYTSAPQNSSTSIAPAHTSDYSSLNYPYSASASQYSQGQQAPGADGIQHPQGQQVQNTDGNQFIQGHQTLNKDASQFNQDQIPNQIPQGQPAHSMAPTPYGHQVNTAEGTKFNQEQIPNTPQYNQGLSSVDGAQYIQGHSAHNMGSTQNIQGQPTINTDGTQYNQRPQVPNVAYSGAPDQYNYATSSATTSQGYAYSNAVTSTTSSQNSSTAPYSYSVDPSYNPALASLDALDKPIKSHVTGEALSNVSFQPTFQGYGTNVPSYTSQPEGYNSSTNTSYNNPTNAYGYNNQSNVNYSQTYQNHPGYNFNSATGAYDYNYGSQNSYSSYENTQQVNVNSEAMGKDPNWSAQGIYTSAGKVGSCETVQSPTENLQTVPQMPNQNEGPQNQMYYNGPYGYQTPTVQNDQPAPVPESIPVNTNYGANMNQSTYMQTVHGHDTNLSYANNQVSTPNENVQTTTETKLDRDVNDSVVTNRQPSVEQNVENNVPVEDKTEQKSETQEIKPELSAFDLLSEIDFTVKQTPLLPEIKVPQISESAVIRKPALSKVEPVKVLPPKEEVIERPAKRDLFSDPSLLNHFTQEVKNLQKLTDSLTNKTPSGLTVLDSKWKTFQDFHNKENMRRSKTIAMQHTRGNIVTEVVPFDDSRLTLKSDPDAYINASFYKQLASWCIPLVISNNPREAEYNTFWKAILENKINSIVCLLSEIEMQGKTYWPTAKGQSLELLDNLKVLLEEVTCTVHWTERKLTVASGKTVLSVTHYQINVFPAKIVCSPLVLLADKILSQTYDNKLSNQLCGAWVHCGAGAGRSAVVALLLMLMCQMRAGQLDLCDMLDAGCINLYTHRSNVLEDTKYLADAYRTALFYVQGVLCSGTTMFNGEAVSLPSGAAVLPPVTPAPANPSQKTTKFSRESFEEMKQAPGLKSGDMKDPLNFLDPLWSLKKK